MMAVSVEQIFTHLQAIDLFAGLAQTALEEILGAAEEVFFERERTLFWQDDPADVFYVVLDGRVRLTQLTPEGQQVIHNYPGPGEAFGIVAVLREIPFPVAAQTVEDTRLLRWTAEQMKALMLRHPQMALNAIHILSDYVLQFQDRIRELSTEKVERRVARALLRLAEQTGRQAEGGTVIDLKLTRQDIAEMTGTTLFTVSRCLSKWQAQGWLDGGGEQIVLKDATALKGVAEDLIEGG